MNHKAEAPRMTAPFDAELVHALESHAFEPAGKRFMIAASADGAKAVAG